MHGATDWIGGRFADGFVFHDGKIVEYRTFWKRDEAVSIEKENLKVGSKLRFISAVTMVIVASSANATNPKASCELDGGQSEMNGCASQRLRQADSQMNALYKEQLQRLSEENRARLRDSQRAWITYRDKACFYETGPQSDSGSIWPMLDALCKETLTKQRNEVLKSYIECTSAPCPE